MWRAKNAFRLNFRPRVKKNMRILLKDVDPMAAKEIANSEAIPSFRYQQNEKSFEGSSQKIKIKKQGDALLALQYSFQLAAAA